MHQMYRFDVWMIWVIELLVTFKKLFWLYILSDSSKRLAKQGTLSVQLPHLPVFWASWPATFIGEDCSCTSSEAQAKYWPFRICGLRMKCFSNHAFRSNKVGVLDSNCRSWEGYESVLGATFGFPVLRIGLLHLWWTFGKVWQRSLHHGQMSVRFRKEYAINMVHLSSSLYTVNRINELNQFSVNPLFFKHCPSHPTSFPVISRRLGTFSAALTTLEKAGKAFLLWHARWSPIRSCWEATSPGSVLVSRPLSVWRTSTTTNVIWLMLLYVGYSASNPTLSKGGYGKFWKLVPLNTDTISVNQWSVADKLHIAAIFSRSCSPSHWP